MAQYGTNELSQSKKTHSMPARSLRQNLKRNFVIISFAVMFYHQSIDSSLVILPQIR